MIEIIGGSVLGAFGVCAITTLANKKNSFIIDRTNLKQWVKSYYGLDFKDLPACSVCSQPIVNEKDVNKIFTRNGKLFVVCKKRGCLLKNNEEVMEIGMARNSLSDCS